MLTVTTTAKDKLKETLQKQTTDPEVAIRVTSLHPRANRLELALDKEKKGDQVVASEEGCKVLLIERSVIIHALLEDGLKRATENPKLENIILENISLINDNSTNFLSNVTVAPDTILLDPMYPFQDKRPQSNGRFLIQKYV